MKIFYDVDTQNDFMNKNGALYVPDAEIIKPNLKLLTDYARENFLPVVGSVDKHFGTKEYKHREGELQRWGGPFLDHCMKDTPGEHKIYETILEYSREGLTTDNGDYIPHVLEKNLNPKTKVALRNLLDIANRKINKVVERKTPPQGVYFRKQSYDVFTNPAFPVFLDMADVKQAVVYGVATDYCVKAAVLGMQQRDIQCYVIEDAIKGVEEATTKAALEEMAKAGAKFVKTKQVLEGKLK